MAHKVLLANSYFINPVASTFIHTLINVNYNSKMSDNSQPLIKQNKEIANSSQTGSVKI